MTATASPIQAAIRAVVARIPPGRVCTYGEVARLAGFPRHARLVGRSLHGPADAVPWFRVINHQGRISPRGLDGNYDYQRILLEDDGVKFDASGRIDLKVYGWHGD